MTNGPGRTGNVRAILDVMGDVIEVEQVQLFLALLAVVAEVLVASALVLAVVRRPALARVRAELRGLTTPFALVVAVIATSGSLWFSEVAHYRPCVLCWWQRGFMYPLVPILLVAWLKPQWRLWRLALPMAVVGAGIATYHSVIERWPDLEVTSCAVDNPCTLRWVEELGYLTIPVMSLSAFLLIATFLLLDPTRRRP